jgi:hypothetical protein
LTGVVDHTNLADANPLVDPDPIVTPGCSIESDTDLLLSPQDGFTISPAMGLFRDRPLALPRRAAVALVFNASWEPARVS